MSKPPYNVFDGPTGGKRDSAAATGRGSIKSYFSPPVQDVDATTSAALEASLEPTILPGRALVVGLVARRDEEVEHDPPADGTCFEGSVSHIFGVDRFEFKDRIISFGRDIVRGRYGQQAAEQAIDQVLGCLDDLDATARDSARELSRVEAALRVLGVLERRYHFATQPFVVLTCWRIGTFHVRAETRKFSETETSSLVSRRRL